MSLLWGRHLFQIRFILNWNRCNNGNRAHTAEKQKFIIRQDEHLDVKQAIEHYLGPYNESYKHTGHLDKRVTEHLQYDAFYGDSLEVILNKINYIESSFVPCIFTCNAETKLFLINSDPTYPCLLFDSHANDYNTVKKGYVWIFNNRQDFLDYFLSLVDFSLNDDVLTGIYEDDQIDAVMQNLGYQAFDIYFYL